MTTTPAEKKKKKKKDKTGVRILLTIRAGERTLHRQFRKLADGYKSPTGVLVAAHIG